MTCSYNVVFLLDTASSVEKKHLHLSILRVLNYLGCKCGLARVRWGFKFFDSLGAQGRTSRVGSFHELGSRSWEDFEEELDARFGSQTFSPHLPGPVPRATLTQNILKETLLDYQWDRPEIASPAKPVLRSHKSKLTITLDKPPASSSSEDFVNAVFLFSPCPHSQRELLQFVFGSYAHLSDELPPSHDTTEKLIPKGMQEMMANQKITLYWVDTTESMKLLEASDDMGYKVLFDFVHLLGGTILPSETFLQCLNHHRTGTISAAPVEPRTSEPPLTPWSTILPFDSTLNCLFSLPSALQASFSPVEGVLFLKTDGTEELQNCVVTLEPLTVSQRCLKGPVNISLKCAVTGWNAMHLGNFRTESWILRSSSGLSFKEPSLFQQFLKYTLVQGLHLVAEVSPFGACSCTGIFSPISDSTAVLSLLCVDQASEVEKFLPQTTGEGNITKDDDFSLLEIIGNVLNQGCDDMERNYIGSSEETLIPEWVQQELSHTLRWSPAVMEGWYSLSNLSGASSHLMESFRLLQADSATGEEEAPKPEVELTQCLSEFYQRKASDQSATSHQQHHRKRCKGPRTPVRQKMKTMPRSLQMLNVARLNVKAQKFHAGEPPVSERVSQRLLSRRLDDNVEARGKIVKRKIGFTTEEEMLSYITTNYQKAVIDGENLLTHAQDMVAAVNIFHKSNKAAFMDTVQSSLLKTSKALRQQLGNDPDKDAKVKECQLQVYLRLETCLQCPSLQDDTDGMEQLVEEMTDMLRILCLTKDPVYLTRFLEEVVDMYMETMPKILGGLYYSLGTQIPAKLASVLPADFFSDDSMGQESQNSPLHASTSSVPVSRTASLSTEAEQLEELRTRSAKKRKNTLARHRSVTEISQNLRQIEIPQVPKNRTRKDNNSHACLDVKSVPAPQKMAVQEVTKVRRNLFNEKFLSPSKRSLTKISRSQSVSVLEGLKRKHSHSNEGPRDKQKLLTKMVTETPVHKQISRRLLQKQIKGRCSDPGSDVRIVEESPEKSITCTLRRSPRIKQLFLDRTLSGSFHSLQPTKRSIQQMNSVHLRASDDQENVIGLASPPVKKAVHSPKSLLFGAVLGEFNLGEIDSHRTKRKSLAFDESAVYQTPRKTPFQSSQKFVSPTNKGLRRSPRLQEKQKHTTQKSPAPKYTAAKSLGNLFSPFKQKSKSLPESFEKKEDPALTREMFSSPSKMPQVQTLGKLERQRILDDVFASPASSCDSAANLSVTIPQIPLNSREKAFSQLQSPRRSLRVAQKIASPASPQKQSLETETVTYLEPHLPLMLDSAMLEVAPRESGGTLSELSPSPKSAKLTEAFSVPVRSPSLPEAESPPSNQTLNAVAMCTVSTARTRELTRRSHTPKETPLRSQNVTDISPPKAFESASSRSEEHLHLYGKNEEDKGRGSISLSDEGNPFRRPDHREGIFLRERHKQANRIMTPNKRKDLDRHLSAEFSTKTHEFIPDAIVVCEQFNISSLLNKACAHSFQVGQDPDSRAFITEKATDLQQPLSQNSLSHNQPSLLTASKSGSCTYALRCTPDRRQREAEARLGNSEKVIVSRAPQTTHPVPVTTSSPTYEVELEMKASGLPKLRIKRVSSMSALELPSHIEPEKPKAEEESDLAVRDLSVTCCGRHSGKLEPASISPSCIRSAHSTPGKLGGGQTYICQSYTPTRCTSYTCSPLQGSVSIPSTPSPKHKGKVTPEAIKDWPRRKKATVGCRKSERHTDAALETAAPNTAGMRTSELLSGNKALHLGEFELEGVCRLQDESPCSDTEPTEDENIYRETSQLKSRKRAFENMFSEEEKDQEAKRSCPKRKNPGAAVCTDELLSMGNGAESSALTPPKSSGKSTISVSGLRALTQSPLLYQGHATSLRKCPTGDDSDVFGGANEDLSPFHSASTRQHFITRTYSRKRLLT
ncbi:treslin [Sceloporus undulatus]|uniref:treslin n=1 Tax=Sceloporus undulatus TaxID=8520 RepID=UPI001C4B88D1|nr:treslin [Sceloporus undulatus]XP_042328314.1 treslin [Sceloporus undulatus]